MIWKRRYSILVISPLAMGKIRKFDSQTGKILTLATIPLSVNQASSSDGVLALDASVDMDMVGGVYADDLKEAIAKDPARIKLLDEAVLRILRVKEQLGLFDKPMVYHDVEREKSALLSAEHREAARAALKRGLPDAEA